jgi:hypothetical protein
MSRSIVDIAKSKRGRKPTTGLGEGVLVRLHEPMIGALDTAAKAEGVGRVELIRRIVRDWLIAKGFLVGE